MLHKKCEVGGGGEGGCKGMLFFHNQQGCKSFFSNLENLSFFSFAIQDSFLSNFGFAGYFLLFFYPRPLIFVMVHPLCPANYSVSLPESVGMRSHLMGVVKPVAQGWGYSKFTLSSQSL